MRTPKNPIEPTPEQSAIIGATHPQLVVRAAAGAGKTYVLVERYLRLVCEEGLSPDQILTITFTRKAAAEMKTRIVANLRDAGRLAEAQIAETGPIQTVHGFCERLLRENSVAAELDPDYEIISGAQFSRLLEEAVRAAIADPMDERPEAAQLVERLAGKQTFSGNSPHAKLLDAVRAVVHGFRGTGLGPSEVAALHSDPHALLERWQQACLAEAPEEVRAEFDDHGTRPFFLRLSDAYKKARTRKPAWLGVHPDTAALDAAADLQVAVDTCGLAQIAEQAWRRLEAAMQREQALDFAALEARAVDLLAKSEETRERVRRQYRAVLVDEAQDLNPMQYRLLEGIQVGQRMFVGDPQQSIYGFRQADVELFRGLMQGDGLMQLSLNKRSGQGILTLVDLVFGQMWAGAYVPMRHQGEELDLSENVVETFPGVELWRQRDRDTSALATTIEQVLAEMEQDGLKKSDMAVLVRERSFAVDLLPKLEQRGIRGRIVGGTERFYTRMEVRDLANTLRCIGCPSDDYALLACLRSPVAGLSLDSIVLLSRRSNSEGVRVCDLLAEFEVPVASDREVLDRFLAWYAPLRTYGDRLSAWEVISSVLAHTPYLERLALKPGGRQQIANVRKLLTLAMQEPEFGPLEYEGRLREIQELRHSEGDAPADDGNDDLVTLMTVHASKGLEFPVVVVPDTHRKLKTNRKEVEVDPRGGTFAANFQRRKPSVHEWVAGKRLAREHEEEDRVMYVAMTRAKQRLCVCIHQQAAQGRFAKRLATYIANVAPDTPLATVRELDSGAERF